MARVFRRLSQMFDLDETGKAAGKVVAVNAAGDGYELTAGGAGADDQTAAEVPFTPAGSLAATDVQAMGEELDAEKAALSHVHAGEDVTSGTVADARIAATIARDSEVTAAISALSSVYQPLDSDLTSIAALTTTAFGRSFLALADAAAARALVDLEPGTDIPSLATFEDHSARHEDGGLDEISLAGLSGTSAALQSHLDDTADAHDASAISFAPAGGLVAGNVQAGMEELDAEKAAVIAGAAIFSLPAGSAVGATSLTLDRAPAAPWLGLGEALWVVIDPGSVKCEVRKLSLIAGSTLTVDTALWAAHSAGAAVLIWPGDEIPTAFWGAAGDGSTDDTAALQAAIDQSGRISDSDSMGFVVTGLGRNHLITKPIIHTDGARVQRLKATCSGFVGVAEADDAAWMSSNHNVVEFAADSATDTFTIVRGSTNVAAPDDKIVFKDPIGVGLPGGITEGKVYWVKTWTGTGIVGDTFTVAATKGGATLNLTSNGAGRAYQKVNGVGRPFLFDVYLNGGSIPGLNGFRLVTQQPVEIRKIRADNFPGAGLIVGDISSFLSGIAQQGEFSNVELVTNGIGAQIYGMGGNFRYLNIEESTTLGLDLQGQQWTIAGGHFEANLADVVIGGVGDPVRANVFLGVFFGATGADTSHVPITVHGNAGYQLLGCRFALGGGSGAIAINDDSSGRVQQLILSAMADNVRGELGMLWQPDWATKWAYLDGLPSALRKVRTVLDFGSVPAGGSVTVSVTVAGVTGAMGGRVLAAPENDFFNDSLFWIAKTAGVDTVKVMMHNPTAAPISPAVVNWNINVLS